MKILSKACTYNPYDGELTGGGSFYTGDRILVKRLEDKQIVNIDYYDQGTDSEKECRIQMGILGEEFKIYKSLPYL